MNRQMKHTLYRNKNALIESDKSLKAIFEIMFCDRDNILCEDNDGVSVTEHTYGEVYDKICAAASGLHHEIGSTGGFVALEIENSLEWIVAFWAILMSGNKPYLVNLRYPHGMSNSILKQLGVEYSVCLGETSLEVKGIDLNRLRSDLLPVVGLFEDEFAFSSSATSMNETVCFYSGYQVAEQILNFDSIVKECPKIVGHYKGRLKLLAFLPFYHIFGLFAVYFWFTFFGRTLVFLSDYSADTILSTCRLHKVTHIFAVPMLWHTIERRVLTAVAEQGKIKQERFKRTLRGLTHLQNLYPSLGQAVAKRAFSEVTDRMFGRSVIFCISGGSYLRQSALELLNGIGYSLHNGYGMSEIGITSVELRSRPKHLNLNSIGRPFDSVEYRLEDGVLCVRGSSICTKKLINGQAVTVENWLNTEDNVTVKDGYYYILGRLNDIVNGENGESINPDTVEQQFNLEDAVMLSVLGLKGESGDELSVIVQVEPDLSKERLDKMVDRIKEVNDGLSNTYAVQRFYLTYDKLLPSTAVKVSRRQLAKRIFDGSIELIELDI